MAMAYGKKLSMAFQVIMGEGPARQTAGRGLHPGLCIVLTMICMLGEI
jgi:hypothetical protein